MIAVRRPDDVRLQYAFAFRQGEFDFRGRNVGAATSLDQVSQPAGEGDPAVPGLDTAVTGAVIAVRGEHVLAFPLVQTLHQRIAPHPDLPEVPIGTGCPDSGSTTRCSSPSIVNPPVSDRSGGCGTYGSTPTWFPQSSVMPSAFGPVGRRSGGTIAGMLVRMTEVRSRLAKSGCSASVLPCCGHRG